MELLLADKLGYPEGFDGYEWSNTESNSQKEKMPSYLRSDLPNRVGASIRKKLKESGFAEVPKFSYFNAKIKNNFEVYYKKQQTRSRVLSLRKERQYQKDLDELKSQSLLDGSANLGTGASNEWNHQIKTEGDENKYPMPKQQSKEKELQNLKEKLQKMKKEQKESQIKEQQLLDDLYYYKIFADKCSRLTLNCVDNIAQVYGKKEAESKKAKEINDIKLSTEEIKDKKLTQYGTFNRFQQQTPMSNKQKMSDLRENFSAQTPKKFIRTSQSTEKTWTQQSRLNTTDSSIPLNTLFQDRSRIATSYSKSQNGRLRYHNSLNTPQQFSVTDSTKYYSSEMMRNTSYSTQVKDGSIYLRPKSSEAEDALIGKNIKTDESCRTNRISTQPDDSTSVRRKRNNFFQKSVVSSRNSFSQQSFDEITVAERVEEKKRKSQIEDESECGLIDSEFLKKSQIQHKSIMYGAKLLKNKFGIIRAEKNII